MLIVVVAVALVVGLVWWIAGRKSGSDSSADVDQASMTTTTPALTGVLAVPEEDPLDETDDFGDDSLGDDSLTGDLAMTSETETSTDANGAVVITGDSEGDAASTTGESADATTDGSAAEQSGESTAGESAASSETKTKKSETTESSESKAKKAKKTETSEPESTTATKPAKPDKPAKPSKPAKPATTAPPEPSYDATGRLLCADDAISVKAITLSTSFPVGTQPRLGMAVTNTSATPCVRDLSGTLQVYTVFTADGDRVWSTNDCFPGDGTDVRQLSPGSTANFLIKWAGTTSEPGCAAPRVQVTAGKYVLVAKLGKLKSAKLPFTMR